MVNFSKIAIVLGAFVAISACAAPEDDAFNALRGTGLKRVQLGGYPFFMCGQEDNFNSEFTALT